MNVGTQNNCHYQVYLVCTKIFVQYLLSVSLLLLRVTFVPHILLFLDNGWEHVGVYAKLVVMYEQLSCYGTWKICELSMVSFVFFKSKIIMRLKHSLVKMISFSPNVILHLTRFIIEILPSVFPDGNLHSVLIILFNHMA